MKNAKILVYSCTGFGFGSSYKHPFCGFCNIQLWGIPVLCILCVDKVDGGVAFAAAPTGASTIAKHTTTQHT
jgi:hypothetical protein